MEGLLASGHQCTLGRTVHEASEINHHVLYLGYPCHSTGAHTLMVTHVDDALKLRKLRLGLNTAKAAICMSSDAVKSLATLGIDRSKLCYVNLAHDGRAKEKRFQIGIATRLYPDGRKREADFVRLLSFISPADFAFKIMGFGWADIVAQSRALGFEIKYFQDFHYESYIEMISALDYLLYLGEDEGSVSFIDALAAGVGTIVRPQGHHIDAGEGITYPFSNFDELRGTFERIASIKHERINAVKNWTWENYARAHTVVWERCLSGKPILDTPSLRPQTVFQGSVTVRRWKLLQNTFSRRLRMILNVGKDFQCGSKLWNLRKRNSSKANGRS
jgi:hypothetical protein